MNRKDEHLLLAKTQYKAKENDFDAVSFVHQSLVALSDDSIDLSTSIAGLSLDVPFYINAMTGGSEKTKIFNQQLAIVARETGLMMATGSVSAALKDPSVADSYTVIREENPNGLLLGNMGAGRTAEDAKKIVDLLQADGLQIHLNVPQELVMPEGEHDFEQWETNIRQSLELLEVPILVKEVGFGMAQETVQRLVELGVPAIDVSGRGGTSFTKIENSRRKRHELAYLDQWGQSTVVSLLEAQPFANDVTLLASGGIRDAFDIFKALSLGAHAVGISGTFLHTLMSDGIDATIQMVEDWKEQLRRLYLMTGRATTNEVQKNQLMITGAPREWCDLRGIDVRKLATR
ncbi:isopentenyl-diphosphate delta-isomerase [Enterococcus florum]|uniref:Isopentenyl-diphosphate delta-isomerase n=1 Tax=Enterococcus florum TaxID=2480627 RepID=A0A4P5PDZ6_9ENTE|nr:type 2 isopentenyl-diphosphate Delta-isomerase [Enterococcus florum]GCF93822.1 isopentenyl-diphosphate delta-isomerase [Enterococcus florum]